MNTEELTEQERKQMFGEENKYTASKLYHAASKFFSKYHDKELFKQSGGATNSERYALTLRNGAVILPPATDQVSGILGPNGDYALKDAIAQAKKYFDADTKLKNVFIPIVQTRKVFFGLFGPERKHFTYLQLSRDQLDAKKITATHVDSKGFLARLYPLDGLRDALKDSFPNTKLDPIYTGQQKFNDDYNCGRYTLSGIRETAINGSRPTTISQAKLDEVDTKYKQYHDTLPKPKLPVLVDLDDDDLSISSLSRQNSFSSANKGTHVNLLEEVRSRASSVSSGFYDNIHLEQSKSNRVRSNSIDSAQSFEFEDKSENADVPLAGGKKSALKKIKDTISKDTISNAGKNLKNKVKKALTPKTNGYSRMK